jgi:AcrR family transcriptional regulator
MTAEAKELWREQLTEARRRQIIEAAASIFAQKGFHRATTKDIATAAGVSEGTIYNYFASKEDLLLSMMSTFITESLPQILVGPPPYDLRATLADIYRDRLALFDRQRDLIRALFPQIFTDENLRYQFFSNIILPLVRQLETQIKVHSDRGVFRPINPAIVTRAIMGFLAIYILLGLTGEDPVLANIPHDELADELAALFIDGLRVRAEETK